MTSFWSRVCKAIELGPDFGASDDHALGRTLQIPHCQVGMSGDYIDNPTTSFWRGLFIVVNCLFQSSLGILSNPTHLWSSKNTSHSSLELCLIQSEIGRDLVYLLCWFASSALVLRLGYGFLVTLGGCCHLDGMEQLWSLRGVLVIVYHLQLVICERCWSLNGYSSGMPMAS
jgi:hypothetical protein